MDQRLARQGTLDELIALGGGFAQARADRQDQVGHLDAGAQRVGHAPAHLAGGVGMALVKALEPAPGGRHGQFEAFGESGDLLDRVGVPAAAAQHHDGPFSLVQQLAHAVQVGFARAGGDAVVARHVGHRRRAPQRVFRQRQHHRAGAAAGGGGVGARHEFRDAVGAIDLRHPLGHLAEHAAIVDLLEGFAFVEVVADLADEQDHRRRILESGMHADAGIGGARATGHEAHAGLAGELAVGLGHVGSAAFLAAYHRLDGAAVLVQRIDAGQVALAWNHEDAARAVDAQLLHQDLSAVARQGGYNRHANTPGRGCPRRARVWVSWQGADGAAGGSRC